MENLNARTYALLFDIQRSVRYHSHRRGFFELWNRATSVITLVGASAALALAIGNHILAPWIMAGIGLLAALDAMIGTARCANEHTTLAQQFITLEQQFAHGRALEDDEYEAAVRRRLEIEAAEPPVKRLLDFLCDLEVRRAHDNRVQDPQIPWLRRIGAHWFSQMAFATKTIKSLQPEAAQ